MGISIKICVFELREVVTVLVWSEDACVYVCTVWGWGGSGEEVGKHLLVQLDICTSEKSYSVVHNCLVMKKIQSLYNIVHKIIY